VGTNGITIVGTCTGNAGADATCDAVVAAQDGKEATCVGTVDGTSGGACKWTASGTCTGNTGADATCNAVAQDGKETVCVNTVDGTSGGACKWTAGVRCKWTKGPPLFGGKQFRTREVLDPALQWKSYQWVNTDTPESAVCDLRKRIEWRMCGTSKLLKA
jgi:hypothetical protein